MLTYVRVSSLLQQGVAGPVAVYLGRHPFAVRCYRFTHYKKRPGSVIDTLYCGRIEAFFKAAYL